MFKLLREWRFNFAGNNKRYLGPQVPDIFVRF